MQTVTVGMENRSLPGGFILVIYDHLSRKQSRKFRLPDPEDQMAPEKKNQKENSRQ